MRRADFVVVGAGSAGCVLADRLSRDPAAEVLLLEAGGGDDRPVIGEPGRWAETFGTDVDWNYTTVPQTAAHHRQIAWPRGKVLGGSSSINAMVFVRGAPHDFDAWAALGATGWDHRSVLPAFRELEDFPGGDPGFRGPDPSRSGSPTSTTRTRHAIVEAAVELGHRFVDDVNAPSNEGVGWNQLCVVDGRRRSASTAFLKPALGRPNLTALTGARVHRLVIGPASRITAVHYEHDGQLHEVGVDGEVVLAAGAVESPKLLMLSGIGRASDLRRAGIRPLVDLPGVGENLHDHPGAPVTWTSRRPIPAGPNQGSEVGLFCRSDPASTRPDLQFGALNVPVLTDAVRPGEAFSFYPSLLKPRSRGRLRLASADPAVMPLIDPDYLGAEADLDALVRAIRTARSLAAAGALAEWTGVEVAPGADVRDDADLREYVRRAVNTWFHPVGTCRIGVDEGAVVDPLLRVRGIANLRVADASVMPEITSGNTNGPTSMIAWRAADLIRTSAASPSSSGCR